MDWFPETGFIARSRLLHFITRKKGMCSAEHAFHSAYELCACCQLRKYSVYSFIFSSNHRSLIKFILEFLTTFWIFKKENPQKPNKWRILRIFPNRGREDRTPINGFGDRRTTIVLFPFTFSPINAVIDGNSHQQQSLPTKDIIAQPIPLIKYILHFFQKKICRNKL